VFIDGQKSRLKVLEAMGVRPGKFCVKWVNEEDERRLRKAAIATQASPKEARTQRRKAAFAAHGENDPAYQAGGF